MRTLSAAETKNPRYHHHRDIPTPGTKIRALFDLFYPPLTVVPIRAMYEAIGDKPHPYMDHLQNFYGLDIRQHHYGHWWLVGEYFPGGYLDYADESYKELAK